MTLSEPSRQERALSSLGNHDFKTTFALCLTRSSTCEYVWSKQSSGFVGSVDFLQISDIGFGFVVLEGASSPDMESSYGGGLLDMVKGGAGRLFSNLKDNLKDTLKDTSSKVMQSVARYSTAEAA